MLESTVDTNRFINSRSQTPKSFYVFQNVAGNINALNHITEMSSKNTLTVVALNDSSFAGKLNFLSRLDEIQQLPANMKIGIFLPKSVSMDDLRELFEWCKKKGIADIFAAIEGPITKDVLNIFTFYLFGPFGVINITISESYENYFPSLQCNFRRQQFGNGANDIDKATSNFGLLQSIC